MKPARFPMAFATASLGAPMLCLALACVLRPDIAGQVTTTFVLGACALVTTWAVTVVVAWVVRRRNWTRRRTWVALGLWGALAFSFGASVVVGVIVTSVLLFVEPADLRARPILEDYSAPRLEPFRPEGSNDSRVAAPASLRL